jgi:FkbM family methyltransferase
MRALAALTRPWRKSQRELRSHLRRLFEARRVDGVIDVGAHRGKFYRLLREDVGFAGPVLSVEPIAELATELEKRASRESGWRVSRCALGARSGAARLNVMVRSDFSSLLQPRAAATGQFSGLNAVSRIEEVALRTLDELMSADGSPSQRLYLKLDTQGFDLEVLQGGARTLSRVVALQSEISFIPIYAGMPSWRESIERIGALGFALSGIFAVSRDPSLRLVEADCVFVRQ